MLEKLLAYHCAPAFAGIKPSNIAVCPKTRFDNLNKEIEILNGELNCKDIYIEILCECQKNMIVMVYRRNVLEKHLNDNSNRKFLSRFGYPKVGNIDDYLNILKERLDCEVFPHEIGVFLGYPLHDVNGFINHRNEGCILSGEWKVYHDEERAKKLFSSFKACRKALVKRVTEHGKTLAQIFCAA